MRYFAFICLSLFSYGCSHGQNFNRGYVISQVDNEQEVTPEAVEPDLN